MSAFKSWDCETTTRTSFKRKANPFDPLNHVVTHAFKSKDKPEITEHRFGRLRPGPGWLRPVLDGTRLLAGFNIKFDVQHAIQDADNLDAWMEYVASGGNVWDCQLAEYLLQGLGQKDQMLALDEVAPRYGGNVKVDEVKALWAAGVATEDIDPELLSRYLCGGDDETGTFQHGDIGNTEMIALKQIDRARAAGQLNSILMNMGALIFTIEAERNGMFVDKHKGLSLAADLAKEVDRLGVELARHLPKDLPFDFNWNSTRQKSALFFGGAVQWDAYEYDLADGRVMFKHDWEALGFSDQPQRKYAQKDELHYVMEDGTTRPKLEGEFDPVGVVRYSGGKNKGEAKTKKVKVDDPTKPRGRGVKAPYTFPRMTEPEPGWKGAEPGVWSTSSEVIEEIGKRDIPFIKLFASLQKMSKDLGTYYISTDEDGNSKGMLTLVDWDWIIHHKLNMCSTVTARLSSSDPNL